MPYNESVKPGHVLICLRLDDRGDDGMAVVANIKKMYQNGDGHVHVLAASFRKLEHLLYSFALGAELATSPAKILEQWACRRFSVTRPEISLSGNGQGR